LGGKTVVDRLLKIAHCVRVHLVNDFEFPGVSGLVFSRPPVGITLPPILNETDFAVGRDRAVKHIHLSEEIQVAWYEVHTSAFQDTASRNGEATSVATSMS
jgi:hypothetical protein